MTTSPPDDEACLGFVGVTTGSSSILDIYPRWAELLGLPARRIVGHDLAPDSPPERYRELVTGLLVLHAEKYVFFALRYISL